MPDYSMPDAPCVINFSGGRSSAYMLHRIVAAHGGALPPHVRVAFCNTGCEHPRTLEFVRDVGEHLRVDVAWLEYRYDRSRAGGSRDPKRYHERVDFGSASRRGEPFDMLIEASKRLPNVHRRFCTEQLKVMTIARWMKREEGVRQWHAVLGIRADEPRRARKMIMDESCVRKRPEGLPTLLPMFSNDVREAEVLGFWRAAPFRLDLPKPLGNCTLCFLKGRAKRVQALRMDPSIGDWWRSREDANVARKPHLRNQAYALWDEANSVADLQRLAAMPDLLEDDGEDRPCYCTD